MCNYFTWFLVPIFSTPTAQTLTLYPTQLITPSIILLLRLLHARVSENEREDGVWQRLLLLHVDASPIITRGSETFIHIYEVELVPLSFLPWNVREEVLRFVS